MVSLKLIKLTPKNRTTEGGQSKISETKISKKTKNRTTEGGESKALNLRLKCEGMGHLVCSKFAFTNSFHLLVLMRLELRL